MRINRGATAASFILPRALVCGIAKQNKFHSSLPYADESTDTKFVEEVLKVRWIITDRVRKKGSRRVVIQHRCLTMLVDKMEGKNKDRWYWNPGRVCRVKENG